MTLSPYLAKAESTHGVLASAIGNFSNLQLGAVSGLTTSTTQTLAGALPLSKAINQLATVAHAGDAVRLPISAAGALYIISNNGANAASIFPAASGDSIDGGSPGAPVTLTNGKTCLFVAVAKGVWLSSQLGAISS